MVKKAGSKKEKSKRFETNQKTKSYVDVEFVCK